MSIFSQIRSILGKNEQEESAATPDKAKTVDAASMTATPGAPVERRSRIDGTRESFNIEVRLDPAVFGRLPPTEGAQK